MRLLNLSRLVGSSPDPFETFYNFPPRYAILSHTWEEEEVTFQDMREPTVPLSLSCKKGYRKILDFARVAVADGYQYGWVDTCCIDKTNLTELSEAINSMFRWYENSSKCYAYLADVHHYDVYSSDERDSILGGSKWFTRGWTLQELIAPSNVVFYTKTWDLLASKQQIATTIAWVTNIDKRLLQGDRRLSSFTVAERMSWASERKTTRPEDIAYALMGLFAINMPLLYGEGASHAFTRLQEEIIKKSDDQSILAWEGLDGDIDTTGYAFAPSPRFFSKGERGLQCNHDDNFHYERVPFTMTNKGLHIRLPVIQASLETPRLFYAVLDCHTNNSGGVPRCIPLLSISEEHKEFCRLNTTCINLDGLLDCPCVIRDIYIRRKYTPVIGDDVSSLPKESKRSLWSTEDIDWEHNRREMGLVDTTHGTNLSARSQQEIWTFIIALYSLWSIFFLNLPDQHLPATFNEAFIFLSIVLAFHHCHARYVRWAYYLLPSLLGKLAVKVMSTLSSLLSLHVRNASKSAWHSTHLKYLQAAVAKWASRRSAASWQWRQSSLVQMRQDEGVVTGHIGSVSFFDLLWGVLIFAAKYHGIKWPEFFWWYAAGTAIFSFSYSWLFTLGAKLLFRLACRSGNERFEEFALELLKTRIPTLYHALRRQLKAEERSMEPRGHHHCCYHHHDKQA